MSRVGKKPIEIPKGVKVDINGRDIKISGPKGNLSTQIHERISVERDGENILVKRPSDEKQDRALHGLWRALLMNMINGVANGYQKKLEIVGVGFKAELKGRGVQLAVGYSHPILFIPPEGIKLEVPQATVILISGIDKQLVGHVAAKIRSFKKPEPYKGKGIKYEGEYIRRKAGKTAASGGAK